jgi:hypothetical protein
MLAALVGGVIGSPGCGRREFTATRVCEGKCPVEAGGVCELGCTHTSDCPQGTDCVRQVCRLSASASIDGDTLIRGFGVREFDLVRDATTDGLEYRFRAPKESRFAECGLFGCEPDFEPIGSGVTGNRMRNASRCLLRSRTFRVDDPDDPGGRDFSLSLAELEPVARACGDRSALNDFDVSYPVITTLSLGCWAYDNAAVIAATRLGALAPADLPSFGQVPIRDEDCHGSEGATEGSYCYQKPSEGACLNHACIVGLSPDAGSGGEGGFGGDSTAEASAADCTTSADYRPCVETRRRLGQCKNGSCLRGAIAEFGPPLVVSNCSIGEADWLNCSPSPIGAIGTCYGDLCRSRCHDVFDCLAAMNRDANQNDAGAPDVACVAARPDQYLKVCVTQEAAP